jgi:hypothetical protein
MNKFILILVLLFVSATSLRPTSIPDTVTEEISIYEWYGFKKSYFTEVTVTMYNPVPEQCNEEPDRTADGSKFDVSKASKLKWVALSRDLLHRHGGEIKYGEIIYIEISNSNKSGFYRVRDTMNKRFTKSLDILEDVGTSWYKHKNVKIYRIVSRKPHAELWSLIKEFDI